MTKAELRELRPGTKLLVSDKFTNGVDDEIEMYLGGVITFASFDGVWVYFSEGAGPENPFRYDEIAGVYIECITDEPYEVGDIQSLLS